MPDKSDRKCFLRSRLAVPFVLAATWISSALSRSEVENVNEASTFLSQTDWMGLYTSTALGGLMAGVDTGLICAAVYWVLWRVNRELLQA